MTGKESALMWIEAWNEMLQVARGLGDVHEYSKCYAKISAALIVLLASGVITREENDKLWAEVMGGN